MIKKIMAIAMMMMTLLLMNNVEAKDEDELHFKVKAVELEGRKIKFKGEFVNEGEEFRKINGLTMNYTLSDEDGYPLLIGTFKVKEIEVAIGTENVEYEVEAENVHAEDYTTEQISFWRVSTKVTEE